MVLLAIPFGLAIGLIVGAVGGGGAILALPVLVYVLGEGVGPASTASLIVVALAAAVGAGARALHGHVCWRLALLFAGPAAAGSLVGALLSAAGTANRNASRQHTRPWRASEPAPIAAASETTTSEAVDAGPTGWSST